MHDRLSPLCGKERHGGQCVTPLIGCRECITVHCDVVVVGACVCVRVVQWDATRVVVGMCLEGIQQSSERARKEGRKGT